MRTEMAAALKVDEQPAAIDAPTGRIPVATVQLAGEVVHVELRHVGRVRLRVQPGVPAAARHPQR